MPDRLTTWRVLALAHSRGGAQGGATTSFLAGTTQPTPVWLRLRRSGTTFTGEVSPNGAAWSVVGSTNVALAANASVGMAVTSHDSAQVGVGAFDNVAVTLAAPSAPCLPAPAHTAAS